MTKLERYKRQITYHNIGEEGQEKLISSRVCIIGTGALGSIIANNLCRAGVGFLRLIDRDIVEEVNLQRQILFTERDVKDGLTKVEAAFNHLSQINSEVTIEPITADVNSSNVERFISDVDLVIDGTDNFEIRFLLNEACIKNGIKWIYGGVVASGGATMNILLGDNPCFRCFMTEMPEPGSYDTCSSIGVLNSITGIIGSYEASEAMKILLGSDEISHELLAIDIWDNSIDYLEVEKNPDCPVCIHGKYEMLNAPVSSYTVSLCGQDAWQVVPDGDHQIDIKAISEKLTNAGEVKLTKFMLSFKNESVEFKLFPDGRAIVNDVKDGSVARSIYAEYIGI